MSSRVNNLHRTITLLVAAWLPFCCCFIKAAQAIVNPDQGPVSCCCIQDDACLPGTDGEPAPPSEESGCTDCCIKVLPDAPQTWEPPVDFGELGICNDCWDEGFIPESWSWPTLQARPPDLPASRTLLDQRCQLLV